MSDDGAGSALTRRVRWLVTGRVQGVGFRRHVARAATALGLAGWVRNREDGRVEIAAAGAPDALRRFEDAVRTGPPAARVAKLEVTADAGEALEAPFAIRR